MQSGIITKEWFSFSDVKPSEEGLYKFKLPYRNVGGLELQPEWVDEVKDRGGYNEPQNLWPAFAHWDGYSRSVPSGLKWRPLKENEKKDDYQFNGLDLKDCPFCGSKAKVNWNYTFIGSRIFNAHEFSIACTGCYLAKSPTTSDLKRMVEIWNKRA
jgi:hypothetical protein